ncbi:MAG: hypothetical protein JKX92_05100 [Porticoccaceae bacterium]|nr:hypothetical protein [Porticoccaceae bacterium]
MHSWCPQQFKKNGIKQGVNPEVIEHAVQNAALVKAVSNNLPPIFSLRHLSNLVGVEYSLLRAVVERQQLDPYKVFKLKKRSKRTSSHPFRIICVPDEFIMKTQKWIAQHILSQGSVHHASKAYAKNSNIVDAANLHVECRWVIKLDVNNFFESFSEISAYRIFRSFGYQPLISFELSRLCTRLGPHTKLRSNSYWTATRHKYKIIKRYKNHRIGHLPQGAPTSPMLSNLAMKGFDKEVSVIAENAGLIYTRYADDLCLSTTSEDFSKSKAQIVINNIYEKMRNIGLRPNITKTQILPPGARKIVLGLLVDGDKPRLSRDFRSKMRMHLYYMMREDIGPVLHAKNRGFESVIGLRNHIQGLIAYAKQVDESYGLVCACKFETIKWPM